MEYKWYIGALSIILSCSMLANDSSPELDKFEIIEGNDTSAHIWVVTEDRKFRERVYCIKGVEYIHEEGYIVLINRDGLPFPCDRIYTNQELQKLNDVNPNN